MGLDGISVNQLRITPEANSSELNSTVYLSNNINKKTVDGLSNGQKVNPDRENKHDNQQALDEEDENSKESDENETKLEQEIKKYDLSQTQKYTLNIDSFNNINIIEKQSGKIVDSISAEKLSRFVSFLSNSQGAIVNRKF